MTVLTRSLQCRLRKVDAFGEYVYRCKIGNLVSRHARYNENEILMNTF